MSTDSDPFRLWISDLRQTTNYQYFPIVQARPERVSFLDLPQHIRQKIYRYSGLVRDCPVDLNSQKPFEEWCANNGIDREEYWLREEQNDLHHFKADEVNAISDDNPVFDPNQHYIARYKCGTRNWGFKKAICRKFRKDIQIEEDSHGDHDDCGELPVNLLLVCKDIYLETLPILYSENRFQVSLYDWNYMYSLEILGSKSLSLIRNLTVSIPCRHDKFWMLGQTLDCIAEDLRSEEVHLGIKIDCFYICTERSMLDGIIECFRVLGTFRSCAVNLNPAICPAATKLAYQLARSFVSTTTQQFSRFLELPEEIQREIISYASLVSSRSSSREYVSSHGLATGSVLYGYNRNLSDYTMARCCGTCSPSHSLQSIKRLDFAAVAELPCFCSKTSSSYSTTCTCIEIPTQLFLVSRGFSSMAQEAFYKDNTFVVTGLLLEVVPQIPAHSSLSEFMHNITDNHIKHIRHLHMRFNIYDMSNPWVSSHEQLSLPLLSHFCKLISQSFEMQQLTLNLDFTPPMVSACVVDRDASLPTIPARFVRDIPAEEFQNDAAILYTKIGELVGEKLTRPKNLWYFLAWPLSPRDGERRDLECHLEKMVMGDEYDSSKTGKPVFEPWKKYSVHEHHPFCMPGGCLPGYFSDPRQGGWQLDDTPSDDDET